MLRDLRKQVFKIFVYVKIISLSRLDYAVYDRTRISTTHRIDEFPVVPAYTERSDRLLSDVVVQRQCRIIKESTQILLLVQAVLDTFLGFIAANCSILCFSRPIEESIDQLAQSKNPSTSGFTSFFRFFFLSDGGSFFRELSVW